MKTLQSGSNFEGILEQTLLIKPHLTKTSKWLTSDKAFPEQQRVPLIGTETSCMLE